MPNADPSPTSILLVAGDVSGDVHAAALARTLLARDPTRKLHALGGARLHEVVRESGGEFLGDTSNCSAIGIPSAVQVYFRCRRLREALRRFLRAHHVDLVVLCDWGAFNGRVLPELHALRIPVLYYFPPSSWRRSGSAGLGIAPYVTRVATPFEWSGERLRSVGCRAEWVGHPALENARSSDERETLRHAFGVSPNETLIALLPASRRTELRVLAPTMAEAARLLKMAQPIRVLTALPRELAAEAREYLPADVEILTDCASDLLFAADAAIVKTGTASLEAVLAGVPHVAAYDVSWLTRIEWCLLWAWKRIPFLAMPNIILERQAVPELIGLNCTPKKIASALQLLLDEEPARHRMREDFRLIRKALGSELPMPATARTADIAEEMLQEAASAAVGNSASVA